MASLLRARAARPEWTVEESATFAARRDFELLKLLSTDKKAFRVARLLGLPFLSQPTPKTHVAGAKTVPKGGSVRAQAQPEQGKSKQRRPKYSQKERKLRQASASKLQALVVGFMTRRKELPAAREIAFRRARAEAATRAAAIRDNINTSARPLAIVAMDVVSHRPKRPAELADKATDRRTRPASPLASSVSSYASCESGDWQPQRNVSPQPCSWEDGDVFDACL